MTNEKRVETESVSYLATCEQSWDALIQIMKNNEIALPDSEGSEASEQNNPIALPFLPLKIPQDAVVSLWVNVFPFLMNEGNASSLDLIVDKDQKVTKAIVHHANERGLITSREEIPIKKLPISQISGVSPKDLFNKLKDTAKKYLKSDLGNLRVIPTELLTKYVILFQKYQDGGNSSNLLNLLGEYLNILIAYSEESKIFFYPQPRILEFIHKLRSYFGNFSYYEIFQKLGQMLPRHRSTVTLWDRNTYVSFKTEMDDSSFSVETLPLPPNLRSNTDLVDKNENILIYLKKTHRCKYNFMLHLPTFNELFNQFLYSEIPLSVDRISYLVQKSLHLQRQVGNSWDFTPKPRLYDPSFRFWTNSFGFLLNPHKISYWSLPKMIANTFLREFGLNSKILVLFEPTDSDMSKLLADKNVKAAVITLHEGVIEDIDPIPAEIVDSFLPRDEGSGKNAPDLQLKAFREEIIPTYGRISHTVWINFEILQQLVSLTLLWRHKTRFGYVKVLKFLRMLRKTNKFQILPSPLSLIQMRKMPPFILLHRVGGIITDLHDF